MKKANYIGAMRIGFIMFFIVLASLSGYGQLKIEEKQGSLITNNGDTLQGFIKFYPLHKLAKEVTFREESEETFKDYTPNEIKGYFMDNIQFMSYKSLEITQVKKRRKESVDTLVRWRFLRKVVEGELDFYVANETSNTSLFYIKTNENEFTELKREVKVENSKKITNDKYIVELGRLMKNHKSLRKMITLTHFSEKGIAHTVDTYNKIIGKSKKNYYYHSTKVDVSINLELDKYLMDMKLYPKSGYSVGIESHIYKPTKSLAIELSYGLYYSMSRETGEKNVFYQNSFEKTEYTNRADFFSLPIYMGFNNKEKLVSFLGEFGISPYLIRERVSYAIDADDIIGKWKLKIHPIINLGMAVNTKSNISMKYIVQFSPYIISSLKISYRFN